MQRVNRYIKAWLPVALWCGVIFYFSHQPDLSVGLSKVWDLVIAKSAHITEYFILALLLLRALKINKFSGNKKLLIGAALAVVYACADEWHQIYVIGRNASIIDVGIDSIGVFLAVLWIKYSK